MIGRGGCCRCRLLSTLIGRRRSVRRSLPVRLGWLDPISGLGTPEHSGLVHLVGQRSAAIVLVLDERQPGLAQPRIRTSNESGASLDWLRIGAMTTVRSDQRPTTPSSRGPK
jgi:hypothetical protein